MKFKRMTLVAVISLLMSFTACGAKETNNISEESETAQITEAETQIQETEAESETEAETETENVEETAAAMESVDFTPVDGLSDNYADLDNRAFAYDGKIFTLGKSTLKDLIDGGIPFDEKELNNKGNNVNKNYETSRYTVRINDFVSMQFTFLNMTDDNLTEEECILSYVRWYSIYVPQPDYDEELNADITANINDAAQHVSFAFPLDLKKEQLLENNSSTTEEDEFNNVEYSIDSDVYMGSSGYTFEFNDKTNQLENVYISWLP